MSFGLIGQKIGMTRVFTPEGISIPVTVVQVLPNRVAQIKQIASDGYNAIQLTTGTKKSHRLNRAQHGHFAKASVDAGYCLKEMRVADSQIDKFSLGQELTVTEFDQGQHVDVTGTSIGKGFAGTIKRHNFRGQRNTHGNSLSHRVPGSIGQNQTPGRVFKGKKMAGQMGNVTRTVQNIEVVRVDQDRQLLLLKGAVPGCKGGSLVIRPSIKQRNK